MATPYIDAKQNYYTQRSVRQTFESVRQDYLKKYSSMDVYSQAKLKKMDSTLEDYKTAEFEAECDFDNKNSNQFHDDCAKMRNPMRFFLTPPN